MLKAIIVEILRRTHNQRLYIFLVKAISKILGSGIKISSDASGSSIVFVYGYQIPHFKRLTFYIYGLTERSRKLADEYLLRTIEFQDGDLVIDCGANSGDLRLALRSLTTADLSYIGFEPGTVEFQTLQANSDRFENIQSDLRNLALAEESGSSTYYKSSECGDGSLLEIKEYSEAVTVSAVTLDSQLTAGTPIKLLKLEAEGLEPEIIRGATETLKTTKFVSVDVGFERGLREESTLPDVVNLMLKSGFSVVDNGKSRLVLLFKNDHADF